MERLSCFKAYDIRGIFPDELNADIAYRIGRAIADETGAKTAVIGYDVRLSSPELANALTSGFCDAGVDVTNIGLCGTEMVYFATAYYGFGAGVMITASHNPPEYNGMKLVREESRPISGDTGLLEIERRTREGKFERTGKGKVENKNVSRDFIQHLLRIVPPETLKPLKVLANAGNGCAGLIVRELAPHIPLKIEEMFFEPDGTFPNGVPNPILEENRASTIARMKAGNFDFGVAWDGDYDRCFFYDEDGTFIEGYYIVGLLAQDILRHRPGATIIYDPRLTWNTLEIVEKMGGRAVLSKTGHAFIKERMRKENAEYGGEMSAHHYFKAHWYCDSGMIPFLMIARLVSQSGNSLKEMVSEMMKKYPVSGEINRKIANPQEALERVLKAFPGGKVDRTDGISIEFATWRFNLRASNTEPVVRLNVESRGDPDLVKQKVKEILEILESTS
ncbi:MAG TPA: phosphomannomutase CpsG [Fimbriimonadales bacterium]|nr:phosphomannomutase CpsG [Fimbriimonadales bacterium]